MNDYYFSMLFFQESCLFSNLLSSDQFVSLLATDIWCFLARSVFSLLHLCKINHLLLLCFYYYYFPNISMFNIFSLNFRYGSANLCKHHCFYLSSVVSNNNCQYASNSNTNINLTLRRLIKFLAPEHQVRV